MRNNRMEMLFVSFDISSIDHPFMIVGRGTRGREINLEIVKTFADDAATAMYNALTSTVPMWNKDIKEDGINNKEMLFVSFQTRENGKSLMVVGRETRWQEKHIKIMNTFADEIAVEMYNALTSTASMENKNGLS